MKNYLTTLNNKYSSSYMSNLDSKHNEWASEALHDHKLLVYKLTPKKLKKTQKLEKIIFT